MNTTTSPLALDTIANTAAGLFARLSIDAGVLPGRPSRDMGLCELAAVLWSPALDAATSDAAWTHLIDRACGDDDWLLACLGLALPSLRRLAARIITTTGADVADVNAELICGFIEAVVTEAITTGVFGRLRARANAACMRMVRREQRAAASTIALAPLHAPAPFESGHVDAILWRAIAAGVITPAEAHVIAITRLEQTPIASLADEAGMTIDATRKRRRRAERRLQAWLQALDGAPTPPHPQRHRL